jgi:acetyl esterase/lipase
MAYTTRESVSALSDIDPELKAFLDKTELPPRDFSDLKALQKSRAEQEQQTVAALGPPPPSVVESTETVQAEDGATLEELVFAPKTTPAGGAPLIVLVHGGGFCLGSPAQYTGLARGIAALYGAVVVSLKYRLAPDHKFPTAPKDCWAGLVWAANNANKLGADLNKGFVLGGVSAGGAITAALAQKALTHGGLPAPLTGLWLSVPTVLDEGVFERGQVDAKYKDVWFSYEQNADAPILDKTAMDAFVGAYQHDMRDPLATPFAVDNAHTGMPKSYVQVCGMDPLRDDGLIYERVLKEHGVETRLDVYPGLPHASWGFLPMLKSTEKIQGDIMKGFGWLLGTEEKGASGMGAGGA